MKDLEFIKAYFKPIQPTVKADQQEVLYREIPPDREIDNFIYCFWQLKSTKPLTQPFIYRVVSDGCIDIFFDRDQPAGNFIMGFCRRFTEFPLGKDFDYVGIRFLPAAFPLLFGINAKSLSDRSQELKTVLPVFSDWIRSNLNPRQSFEKIGELLNGKLSSLIREQDFDLDPRFFDALHLIFRNKGFLDIEKHLSTGLSPRQLRRIFNYYIGTTPKAFSNVVRFQYILSAKPSRQSLTANKFYLDVGFFDQAHFIKHFKNFYGVTPTEAFR